MIKHNNYFIVEIADHIISMRYTNGKQHPFLTKINVSSPYLFTTIDEAKTIAYEIIDMFEFGMETQITIREVNISTIVQSFNAGFYKR